MPQAEGDTLAQRNLPQWQQWSPGKRRVQCSFCHGGFPWHHKCCVKPRAQDPTNIAGSYKAFQPTGEEEIHKSSVPTPKQTHTSVFKPALVTQEKSVSNLQVWPFIMMFCLFISENDFSVLLKVLGKDLKSGAHSHEIKKLESEYSDFK